MSPVFIKEEPKGIVCSNKQYNTIQISDKSVTHKCITRLNHIT